MQVVSTPSASIVGAMAARNAPSSLSGVLVVVMADSFVSRFLLKLMLMVPVGSGSPKGIERLRHD
jgi:hypothetical protein